RFSVPENPSEIGIAQFGYYLDEFTFRFNRRKSGSRGQLFYRLLEQAVQVDPQPDKSMVGGKDFLNSRTF
ncbi:MAG: hypothetical protein AAB466_14085, partial [Verrucomicrobiota bacterium]